MSKKETQSSERKDRWGDRKDAWLVRDMPGLSKLMPFMYPNKCDNEAFIRETIDLTPTLKFIEEKNKNNQHPELPYKVFHVVVAVIVKAFYLRPKMNRFIRGKRVWHRKEISTAFMVKKQFNDHAEEGVAFITHPETSNIDFVHESILKRVSAVRSEGDSISDAINIVTKMPHLLLQFFMWVVSILDYHGHVPAGLMEGDPSYASVFISNLGSIKLNAGYHHLSNRGSNSVFVTIGEMHKAPVINENGKSEIKTVLDLGITLDERIADGYYYAKTMKLIKYLFAHPELLDTPAIEEVDYE